MYKIALKFANQPYLVYNIQKLRREFMWFENVVVILTWFIIFLLSLRICIKKKNIANFIVAGLDILLAVIYLLVKIMNMEQNVDAIKILALIFMYIVLIM